MRHGRNDCGRNDGSETQIGTAASSALSFESACQIDEANGMLAASDSSQYWKTRLEWFLEEIF